MKPDEFHRLTLLSNRDFGAFLEAYADYQEDLLIYCFLVLKSEEKARKAVTVAFQRLWDEPAKFKQPLPLYSIVFREVKFVAHFMNRGVDL